MSVVSKIMKQQSRIRNVTIIAHVDHGKTALSESLAHARFDEGQEEEKGITIKSAAISLQFGRTEYDTEEKKEIEAKYLINLIDSPGHVDFSSEVTAALRITDGAICVVDCIEGVCVQTETVLRQAILERVKPVLFINKCDRIWLEQKLGLKETYTSFRNTISSVNAICETYKDEVLGDINMDPTKNNVGFGSGYFGYGFTLNDFAKMYTGKFGISNKKMCKKLWGNNYFDAEQKKWTKQQQQQTDNNKSSKQRPSVALENGFCKYVLKPLKILHDSIMNGEKEIYEPIISALRLDIKPKELRECEKPKDILRLVMSTWLPARNSVLDLCADNLPSPVQAQKYRIPKLYTGPMDTQEAQDMLTCNPNGTLSMYVSKMIPIKRDPGRFIAFGRVFSGTIKRGQELRILGQAINNDDDEQKQNNSKQRPRATKKRVSNIIMMMGNKPETLNECPAGNVCGLMGIDKYLTKSGTLADSEQVFPFRTMKFSVSPVVKCAVNVVDSKNLKKLVEGLNRLSKYDNIISITQNKQGQQIIAGSGELHLQTCLTTLRDDFMNGIKINTTQPIVSYMEGINDKSGTTKTLPTNIKSGNNKWSYPSIICCKSPDKLNRIYISCQPLSREVCEAIENDKIKLQGDMKTFGRKFASLFPDEWHKDDAAKIWSFGEEPYGKCNILVDQTRAVDYLKEVKGSIIDAFRQITNGGILSDEPLRGVRFNIIDAKIHSDPSHRGPGQLIPATVRACYGALLAATPIIYEPMYSVTIEVPIDSQNGVFNTLGIVRGEFVEMKDKTDIGIPLCSIKAFIPIIETLKSKDENGRDKQGFTELLRENTKGKAFPVMKFSHWQKVDGDPLIKDSLSNKVIMSIRQRKGGMKMEIPQFTDYYDKIN